MNIRSLLKIHLLCILGLCSLISGCATLQQRQTPPAGVTAEALKNWDLRGTLAIRQANRGQTVYVFWRQRAKRYYIHLSGPLGAGSAIIEGQPGRVTLKRSSSRETLQATNADTLLQQALNIKLPIRLLYYWVRALPAPGPISMERHNDSQQLVQLKQQGWDIHYLRFAVKNGTPLPKRMTLSHKDLNIKFVISSWQN